MPLNLNSSISNWKSLKKERNMGLKTLVISKWIEICMNTILNLLWEQSWPKYDSKFNIAYSIAPYGFSIMAVFLGTQSGQFSQQANSTQWNSPGVKLREEWMPNHPVITSHFILIKNDAISMHNLIQITQNW